MNHNGKADSNMSQEESKFDMMRLVAEGDEASLHSLEDILREFSEEDANPAEGAAQTEPVRNQEEAPQEPRREAAQPPRETAPEPVPQTPEETPKPPEEVPPLPDEEEPAPPVYENLSEAEIADEIAKAVAHTFEGEQPIPVQRPAAAEQPEVRSKQKAPQPESAEKAAQPRPAAAPAQKPAAPAQKAAPAPKRPAAPAPAPTPEPEPEPERTPKKKRAAQPRESYFGTLLADIYQRQLAALPNPGTSLRAMEKRLSAVNSIDRLLSPLRYVILVLMVLCIGGRSVSWMTLGFMSGVQGTLAALVLTIIALLLCWRSVYRGIRDIWYLRPSYETCLLLSTLLTMAEALATRNETTLLPLLTIAWCLTGTANLMTSQGHLRSIKGVITARGRQGIRTARGKWEHGDVIGKAPVTTAGFVRRQARTDVFHTGGSFYFPVLFVVSLVISAYLSAKKQENYLSVLVTLLDIGMPVSMVLCCARPYSILTRALRGKGAVAGWGGIRELYGKKSVLIYDSDLFPREYMTQQGVRSYGKMTSRALVSYGASMALRANVALGGVFTKLLREVDGEIYDVSYFQIQETGLEGYIHRNLVHLGSYQYMQLMGVQLPAKAPKYGVYIAINRNLEGLFGVKYRVAPGARAGFHRFVREPRLTPLLVTRNFCVNPGFVEHWFRAPVSQVSCPKAETRRMLSEPALLTRGVTCGFTFREGVAAYSRTVAGARRVYRMGFWYTVAAILLSLVLTVQAIVAISTGGALISAQRLLLLHLILYILVEIGARVALRR